MQTNFKTDKTFCNKEPHNLLRPHINAALNEMMSCVSKTDELFCAHNNDDRFYATQ